MIALEKSTNIARTTGQFGPILKRLRKAKGWSQLELGKKIGLSQERISVIENHPERVSIDQILTVLMALDAELQVNPRNPKPSTVKTKVPSKGGNPNPGEGW
jgi:HTH-type transcriptional regulator / antitoxin HipB